MLLSRLIRRRQRHWLDRVYVDLVAVDAADAPLVLVTAAPQQSTPIQRTVLALTEQEAREAHAAGRLTGWQP